LLAADGKRPVRSGRAFADPAAALCAYQWFSHALYGHGAPDQGTDYAEYAKGLFVFRASIPV